MQPWVCSMVSHFKYVCIYILYMYTYTHFEDACVLNKIKDIWKMLFQANVYKLFNDKMIKIQS